MKQLKEKLKLNLSKKLEALANHLRDLKEQKRSQNKAMNEQIKMCEKKLFCIAQTLKTEDETFLVMEFNQNEIEVFNR